ncbi:MULTISPECIES: N-acetyltransferase [Tenebrionibacter/Tenebrionicola group]|uniref:N-acetyltransferase n=2 Tax=Tenebrionibacter/Tenebrionicola group TaxID=2969848 RepID=A0A8K0V6F6_9ENTR|nr:MULTISPECIES: N-acetyltransferase [Tenebrionibacter/Tenebrionicola group]MBK4716646.1 N-acetyltransferase [Tenebrionibacter intestinalis]MBV5097320.1 N-acetyltransferase [Tenebrionicola larvae]
MIRQAKHDDTPAILGLWLESTIAAHPFISAAYWHESLPYVRDIYLPYAHSWVYDENGIQGFISVLEQQFIGALFVRPDSQHRGAGRALMQTAQRRYPTLSLEVYQQNTRAITFYQAMGFTLVESAWQPDTRHATWIMRWQADQRL